MARMGRGHNWARMAIALGAIAALLAGCALGGRPTKPALDLAASQVLRVALFTVNGVLPTLDPDIVSDTGSQTVIDLLYDTLVTLDTQMRVEPWGAAQVDISADGLEYTFHIRTGQRFADGTPVTAANYAYSLNRTLNPCVASGVAFYLFAIKDAQTFVNERCQRGVISRAVGQKSPALTTLIGDSIAAPDPTTLTVTLAQPAAYFLAALTYPVGAALDPNVIGPDPSAEGWQNGLSGGPHGRGTGGMFAVSRWDHAQGTIVLKPNPYWWGLSAGKKPHLTEIDVTTFADESTELSAYASGRFDLALPGLGSVFTDGAPWPAQRDFHRAPTFIEYAIIMNSTTPPYNNLDAREALCLAVNRDALTEQIDGGQYLPTWHIVPQGMPGYNAALTGPDGVTSTSGNPTAARVHWDAYLRSLHGAKPPEMRFYYFDFSRSQQQLASALAQQWLAVLSIAVTPRAYEIDTWLGVPPPSLPPLTRFAWQADYPEAQDILALLRADSPYNPGTARVPAADALLRQADATTDRAQRDVLYNQAEQLYVNAVAWCPLFQGTAGYLLRPRLRGWQMDGRGLTPLDSWLATYIART